MTEITFNFFFFCLLRILCILTNTHTHTHTQGEMRECFKETNSGVYPKEHGFEKIPTQKFQYD